MIVAVLFAPASMFRMLTCLVMLIHSQIQATNVMLTNLILKQNVL